MPHSSHPIASSLRASDTGKVVSARDAVRLIQDGDTVATSGFVGCIHCARYCSGGARKSGCYVPSDRRLKRCDRSNFRC